MLKRALRSPSMVAGALLVVLVVLFAALAPLIAPEGFDEQDLLQRLQPPTAQHPLGTDELGRSILSRLAWGGRYSLEIGLVSVLIGAGVGVLIGTISGFYGGLTDRVLMGAMDVLLAFPGILLAIAIAAGLGPGLFNLMVAVGVRNVPSFARLVRGQALSVRGLDYVEAVSALGARDQRVLGRHVLPNILAPIIVLASLNIATAILSAAGLSFLGLGAQPPLPDWGSMINAGRQYLRSSWWIGVFPGFASMLTVLGFNLMGDGLRDLLDPRLKL